MLLTRADGAVIIGLEIASLQRFRERPLDTYIPIARERIGLPQSIVLFSARKRKHFPRIEAMSFPGLGIPLFVGLDFSTIDALVAKPLDLMLQWKTARTTLAHDVWIFSGSHPAEMVDWLETAQGFRFANLQIAPELKH